MAQYTQTNGLSWPDTLEEVVRYFFWSAFNRSSEIHERNSHYGTVRAKRLDSRLASTVAWEQASEANPKFVLEIPWPSTGHTLASAVELSLSEMPKQKLNPHNIVASGKATSKCV
jgi:hypothetical protein